MNKIALVTGGNGGIGEVICQRLRDDGFQVIAISSSDHPEYSAKAENANIALEVANVADFDSCQALAERVKNNYGVPAVIVNNAGITRDSQFKKMTLEQWQAVIATNLSSVFNVTRPFINEMMAAGWGRIINISSINGQKGQFGQTNYSAAKAGMHGFTMALAQETASKGITVNTISPGYTATSMVTAIREDILQGIINQIPLKRLAQTSEIAAAVSYLCSEQAGFISGANLPINGAQFTSF